jgi:glycosyltransferase involved in cell wall biosynthesis
MGISVIIPTFDNIEFIDETLTSIYNSGKDLEYEILVGIDGCKKSLNYLKDKTYPSNTKIYYFSQNKGPYLIKNTLSTLAKYDNLLFFDSDDMMEENMIGYCLNSLNKHQCVKPRLRNFRIIDGKMVNEEKRKNWGEGVFAINKEIFNYYNGFEGWLVAADSDFMGRLYKNNISVELTQEILVLRRLHDKGLTSRTDTGLKSELRSKYAFISKSKKYFGPLPTLKVSNYTPIENAEYVEYENTERIEYENVEIDYSDEQKEKDLLATTRKDTLNKVFNKTKSNPQKEIIEKKPSTIDYEKINKLFSNRVNTDPRPKKVVENKPENRQEIIDQKITTNKKIAELLLPGKKNRRNGDPIIHLGGKFGS